MPDALKLPAKLDLSAVTALHTDLVARKDDDVSLDMGDVTSIGALCLQVLIAAARQAKSAGTAFTLCNMNDRLVEQLRVIGMTPEMIMEGQP